MLRREADLHFLIVALTRLRRAADLASKVPTIEKEINKALKDFDLEIPNLKTMRDVAEHIDDYAIDHGRNTDISRKDLEIYIYSSTGFN